MHKLYVAALLLLLFNKDFTQSLRCAQQCTFTNVPLNYVLPTDHCAIVDKPREEQHCSVQLTVDFVSRIVNGSLDAKPQLLLASLKVDTSFSLKNPSIVAIIEYSCSTTDYCDQEFVRETLGSALANIHINTLRQNLVDRLYNPSNTNMIPCSSKDICAVDEYCTSSYLYLMMTDPVYIEKFCTNSTNSPNVRWMQEYAPIGPKGITQTGFFDCNKMPCDDNATVLQLVNMIKEQYILPMNLSVLNTTAPPPITTTPSSAHAFDTVFNRFCLDILPSINSRIEQLIVESSFLERILCLTNYPSLRSLGLYDLVPSTIDYLFSSGSHFIRHYQSQIQLISIIVKEHFEVATPVITLHTFTSISIFVKIFKTFENLEHLQFKSTSDK